MEIDDIDKDKIFTIKNENVGNKTVYNDANVEVDVHYFLGDIILDETWLIPKVKEYIASVFTLVYFYRRIIIELGPPSHSYENQRKIG